jgi:hypothetical protein
MSGFIVTTVLLTEARVQGGTVCAGRAVALPSLVASLIAGTHVRSPREGSEYASIEPGRPSKGFRSAPS